MDTTTFAAPARDARTARDVDDRSLELRVLDGAQAGATAPLPADAGCVLAIAPDGDADDDPGADVVLRDPTAPATRVRIVPGTGAATVDVLEGEVHIGARRIGAGESGPWAPRTALRIGATTVAFGPAGDASGEAAPDVQAAWNDVLDRLEGRRASDAATGACTADANAGPGAGVGVGLRAPRPAWQRPELWLAGVGAVAVLACAIALSLRAGGAPNDLPSPADGATASAGADANPAAELERALAGSPFPALSATRDPLGRIVLGGRLETLAERQQLDAWLAGRPTRPTLQVHVDEAIVRDVTDVFRVNGVAVRATRVAPGRIAVDAAERDPATLARAEEVVRRDVRGLAGMEVTNRVAPPPPKPAAPVVDDPAKRIASVVPGRPAHVVTADGARYFVGALLPGNLRIVRIAGTAVVLDRDGETTTLNF